jgi:hypothetical protein
MSSLLEMLAGQLGGDTTAQISRQRGSDQAATGKAISAALPVLMGALARNTSGKQGAESLAGALARDHDGSILDNLSGFLQKPETGSGEGILGHVLGSKRPAVEQQLGRQTGLDTGSIAKLLPILAPIVMGALGRAQRQGNLDTNGLSSMLAGERKQAESAGSLGGLAALLDADRDGNITDDVAKAGMGLLGRLLRRRS